MIVLRPLRQPTEHTCGQTCLAMVSGLPVPQLQRLVRKRGRTAPADLVRGLELVGKRGVRVERVYRGIRFTTRWGQRSVEAAGYCLPAPAIVLITGPKVRHWVLFDGEHIFDPAKGYKATVHGFVNFRLRGNRWRFTTAITWDDGSPFPASDAGEEEEPAARAP